MHQKENALICFDYKRVIFILYWSVLTHIAILALYGPVAAKAQQRVNFREMSFLNRPQFRAAAAGAVVAVILLTIYSGFYKNSNILYQISNKRLSIYRVAQTTRQLSKGKCITVSFMQ